MVNYKFCLAWCAFQVSCASGGAVKWDAAAQTVSITLDDTTIRIIIGEEIAYVNGEAVTLDSPAFIENGRTYLPLRFIMENLNAWVIWDGNLRTVRIIPKEQ